jgi:hypothetical protein
VDVFDPNAVFDAVLIRIKVVIDFLRLKLHEGSQTVNPMIDQNITDKLTSAARDWATVAGRELREQPILKEAFHACLNDADVQIVVKLRHGAIELQGSTENNISYSTAITWSRCAPCNWSHINALNQLQVTRFH